MQLAGDRGHGLIKRQRVFHGHFQHFVNIAALVANFQRFPVITLALALVARHINIREKVHRHLNHAVALTGFAAPALDVEAESARLITSRPRFRDAGE